MAIKDRVVAVQDREIRRAVTELLKIDRLIIHTYFDVSELHALSSYGLDTPLLCHESSPESRFCSHPRLSASLIHKALGLENFKFAETLTVV